MDWKRKLTSRKFWVTVADFVSMMIVACGNSEDVAVKVTALILAGGGVIAYIIGEGFTDAAAVGQTDEDIYLDMLDEEEEPEEKEVKTDVD